MTFTTLIVAPDLVFVKVQTTFSPMSIWTVATPVSSHHSVSPVQMTFVRVQPATVDSAMVHVPPWVRTYDC